MVDATTPTEVRTFGRTLRHWLDHICAWLEAKVTNGLTARSTTCTKRIRRIAFGLHNDESRMRLYAGKPNQVYSLGTISLRRNPKGRCTRLQRPGLGRDQVS